MTTAAKPLVTRPTIRLAMLGMVDGNGHPYSWSAMFNGYDPDEMAKCPFAGIPVYLNKEPKETLRIPNAQVTHVWADDPEDARRVSRASLVPNVVARGRSISGAARLADGLVLLHDPAAFLTAVEAEALETALRTARREGEGP